MVGYAGLHEISGKISSLWRRARIAYRRTFVPSVINVNGVRLRVASFPKELQEHVYSERYESEEARLVQVYLNKTDSVLEIGGGAGYISVLAAKRCGSRNVVVFEPNPHSLNLMRETFILNQVSPDIVEACVSDRRGEVAFNVTGVFWSSSTRRRKGKSTKIEVPAVSLTEMLEKHKPSFLVIDVEGGEVQFVGSTVHPSVQKIVIELHEHIVGADEVGAVRSWISNNGFRLMKDGGGKGVSYYARDGRDR